MLTFRQFLSEAWGRGFTGLPRLLGKHTLKHSANVHGHDVDVLITKRSRGSSGNHVQLDFAVNGSFIHKAPEHGQEILKHVHNVVNNYIQRKKPSVIMLHANHRSKYAAYKAYAHTLAKHHGGTAREVGLDTGIYRVDLNHGN